MLGYDQPNTVGDNSKPAESSFVDKDKNKKIDPNSPEAKNVSKWIKRIKDAKKKYEDDFKRMVCNMDFIASIQWSGQDKIETDKYVVNETIRTIEQRVATLYARNPKVVATRRPRLDFQLWDEKVESITQAVMGAMQVQSIGGMVPPQLMALMNDYQQGMQRRQLIDKVCRTLEKILQYEMDSQEPNFKMQMKQLVNRVAGAGVGYIKVGFCREEDNYDLTHSETRMSSYDRIQAAQRILERLNDGNISESDAQIDQLKQLIASLKEEPTDAEATAAKEHLVFDFPKSTAIIPDESCSILRGFIGAHWVAEEFDYPLEFVNAKFGKDIKPGVDIQEYGPDGKKVESTQQTTEKTDPTKNRLKLWQVHDLDTKSTFILCDGYKDYIKEPEVVTPAVRGFWTIFPVTFHNIEVLPECKATIFPPSDVDLIKSAQKAINNARQALGRHRKANRPQYPYPDGMLAQEDLDRIASSDDQQFIPIKGVPPGTDISKIIAPLGKAPIDPTLYDDKPMQEDILRASGNQEANVGPAQPNVTATVGSIAEQSRISVASSDVDGLDDAMTDSMDCAKQFVLMEFSTETALQIAGPGAVLPEQDKTPFLNEIEMSVQAASSGRPNKAVDIQNWTQLMPLILQAAQMPPQAQPTIQACIRQSIKVLDANLEPEIFFPLPVPMAAEQPPQSSGTPPPKPSAKQARQPSRPVGRPAPSTTTVPMGGG